MNLTLKKEIISHIFKTVGLFNDKNIMKISMIGQLNSEDFLIDKKIAFETEDKKQIQNKIWATTVKIENSDVKILIADISEDIQEFTLILQMDSFVPCAMRLSMDEDDNGSMYINVENDKWIEATTTLQARMLVGVESLSELYLQWKKLDKYSDMYKSLVGFLNFYEQDEYAR